MVQKLNKFSSPALVKAMRERNSTMSEADAKLAVARVFDALDALMQQDPPVRVVNFGIFRRKYRDARTGRNPRTGEVVHVQGRHAVTFKQAKSS